MNDIPSTEVLSEVKAEDIENNPNLDVDKRDPYDFTDKAAITGIVEYLDSKVVDLKYCNDYLQEYSHILRPYFQNLIENGRKIEGEKHNPYEDMILAYNANYKFENHMPLQEKDTVFLINNLAETAHISSQIYKEKDFKKISQLISQKTGIHKKEVTYENLYKFFLDNYNETIKDNPHTKEAKVLKSCISQHPEEFIDIFHNSSTFYGKRLQTAIHSENFGKKNYKEYSISNRSTIVQQIEKIDKFCEDDISFLSTIIDRDLRSNLIRDYLEGIKGKHSKYTADIVKETQLSKNPAKLINSAVEHVLEVKVGNTYKDLTRTWLEIPQIKASIQNYIHEIERIGLFKDSPDYIGEREYYNPQFIFHSTDNHYFLQMLDMGSVDSLQAQLNKKGFAVWSHAGKKEVPEVILKQEQNTIKIDKGYNVTKQIGTELNEICFTEPDSNAIYQDKHIHRGSVTLGLHSSMLQNYSFYFADGLHLLDKYSPNQKPLSISLDDLLIFTTTNNTEIIDAIVKQKGKEWAKNHLVLNTLSREGSVGHMRNTLYSKFVNNSSIPEKVKHLKNYSGNTKTFIIPTGKVYKQGINGEKNPIYTTGNIPMEDQGKGGGIETNSTSS